MLAVGAYEEKIFKKRSEIREKYLRRFIRDSEDAVSRNIFEKCTYVIKF